MTVEKEMLEEEKKYLEKVKQIIKLIIKDANQHVDKSKNEINELKKFMWDQLSDYTDEERAIQMHDVDHNVDVINMQIDSIFKYEKALKNPFFGKVMFHDDDYNEDYPIYIGGTTVQNKTNFFVFDWRAPISNLFYNFELGDAKYIAPAGEISGKILSKMQFKIIDGEMVRCFQSDINIDDDYLQEILANSTSDKMKNIVSTIQREQNEIIRNDEDKYLIVQGVAGSGKTSVALHRIAYLMYKDLKLSSNNILIFSPSDVFSDYISDVLPELGEQNVLKTTFSDFSLSYLKPYKKIEKYSEFLERIYTNGTDNISILKYKFSEQYKDDLNKFIEIYDQGLKFKSGLTYGKIIISNDELQYLFSVKYRNFSFKDRIDSITEKICLDYHLNKKKYYNAIRKWLCENLDIELNFFKLYNMFMNSSIFKYDNNYILKDKIYFEDIAGMLYMYFKINGFPRVTSIKHIVIDEAQDYTPFQLYLIKRIFSNSSFTVLGDVNQTINPCYLYDSLAHLKLIFNNCKYIELNRTYRSSKEIIDYSNKILGINNICSVRNKVDIPVNVFSISESNMITFLKNDLNKMVNNGFSRIAIITKDVKHAIELFKQLENDKKINVQLISNSDMTINSPLIIIPSYLSKGLEFDGVISFNKVESNYNENDKHLFYVVCTRAQHQLNIYNEPKKILKNSKIELESVNSSKELIDKFDRKEKMI